MTPAAYNAARERLGLTHKALAKLIEVHPVTSKQWGSGRNPVPPPIAALLTLIEAIGVDEARRILEERRK